MSEYIIILCVWHNAILNYYPSQLWYKDIMAVPTENEGIL